MFAETYSTLAQNSLNPGVPTSASTSQVSTGPSFSPPISPSLSPSSPMVSTTRRSRSRVRGRNISPSPPRDTQVCGRGRRRGQGRGRGRARGVRRGQGRGRGPAAPGLRHGSGNDDTWVWSLAKGPSNPTGPMDFSGNTAGPKGEACGVMSPIECFRLFFPSSYIDELLFQTNLYADQQRASKNDNSHFDPIIKEELLAFIGINIAMGVVSLPSIDNYWSTSPILTHPWFRTIMSRNRFREILRYIHVADNSSALDRSDPAYDKLWKVRPLLDIVSQQSLKLYSPHPQISVDESMIGTKSRLSFIQYMPKKPVKWGIKNWVCADAVTGYILTFDVYCGANASQTEKHPKGLAYSVVMKLVEPYLDKGYSVYMDNYYSSPELFRDLLLRKTTASGTVRLNRKYFPDQLKPVRGEPARSRGTTSFAFHGQLTMVRWIDNKDVYALSTIFSDTLTTARRRVGNHAQDIPCPQIISDYNAFMGGVDLADQAMCYYSIGRKSMKWWRRLLWRMIDHVITNAYVIYAANNSTSLNKIQTRVQFRLQLANDLATPAVSLRKVPGRSPTQTVSRLTGKHFPYWSGVKKRCAVCAYKKTHASGMKKYKDKKITTWCPKCEVHLCIGTCFEIYHTRVNYKH